MPYNIYDNPDFFEGYSKFRRSREALAGAPEWPTLRSMLPPLEGLRVLDMGCGFGAFARWAREMGAASVLGVDLSENMLARARAQTQDPKVTYYLADIENLELPDASFDLVYSTRSKSPSAPNWPMKFIARHFFSLQHGSSFRCTD